MHGRSSKEESASEDSRVILTGPGNVKRRKEKHSTSIQWQVRLVDTLFQPIEPP